MAKRWLIVDDATGKVLGWQQTGKNSLPTANPGTRQVVRTDAEMQTFFDLEKQAINEGRKPVVIENSGALSLEADARPTFEVTHDLGTDDAIVGVTNVNFTVKKLDSEGNVDTSFNEVLKMPFNGKLYKLDFTAGGATQTIKFQHSGKKSLFTTNEFKVKTPLEFDVVEN